MALFSRKPSKKKADPSRPPVPFIVGVGRSGTTMLRLMLDAHPELTIPPETHFVPDLIDAIEGGATPEQAVEVMTAVRQWGDLHTESEEVLERWRALDTFEAGPALRSFYEIFPERMGKPRYGEKTPAYVKSMVKIESVMPEARFIHVIRDGRDVALSRWKRTLGDKDPAPASKVAETWARRIRRAQRHGKKVDHYMELRYEDLVTDTEPNLRAICEFLELDWDPVVLTYYEHAADRMAEMARDLPAIEGKPTRPGAERMQAHAMTQKPPDPSAMYRWKEKMKPEDIASFDAAAGYLLAELGYEVGTADAAVAGAAAAEDESGSPSA
ncbi:MAG: sulfotransferase [Solirubrobacterales bacterium]